jgi:hypothetical protein
MTTQKSISELALALHDKKILNIDSSLRDTLAVGSPIFNNGDKVADWNIVGGSHYVLVTGLQGDLEKVANPAAISHTVGTKTIGG